MTTNHSRMKVISAALEGIGTFYLQLGETAQPAALFHFAHIKSEHLNNPEKITTLAKRLFVRKHKQDWYQNVPHYS